ncbi:MAG: phage tail tape measure protein [Actinobacteria bacterium]|nr:phage tail tape measure protein [Actinomycetota bacterium]
MPSAKGIRAGRAFVELFADDTKLVRGLRRAERKIKAFGAGIKKIGARMARLSALMAAPLVAGGKVFVDFEQQLAKVSTMLDDPAKYMDAYKKAIRNMAVEFGESTEALANGLYDILSASIPAERALDTLAVAVKAAKGGMTDTATAADALTTVLNSYGLSAAHAQDVSDLLFTVVKRGKLTFADLAPTIGMVASIASSAGVSLDEMGASIATMTRSGVKSERAVTALANIIKSFLTPTQESIKAARALGFEMNVATLGTEGLAGVFERIKKLPPDTIAKLFPNIRALRGVIPALKNIEGFQKDLQLMAKRAGSTQEAYDKMANTLGHLFSQVKEAAKLILSVTGEALAQSLAEAATKIKKYSKVIVDLIQKNQQVVVTIAKMVVLVGAAGIALIILGSVISGVGAAFGAVASVVSAFGTAIGVIGSVLAALLSPLGLVITAVVGLGGYLIYASGAGGKALSWLGEKFSKLAADAKKAFGGIADALVAGDIGLAAQILWGTLKLWWLKGTESLRRIWIEFKAGFVKLFAETFYGGLKVARKVWEWLEIGWTETTAFFAKAWYGFVGFFQKTWERIKAGAQKAWNWIKSLFDDSIDLQAENKLVEQEKQKAISSIDDQTQRRKAEREAQRGADRQKIDAEANDFYRRQDENKEYLKQAADDIAAEEQDALTRQISDLKRQRDEAIKEARQKREAKDADGPGQLEGPDALLDKLKGLGDTIAQQVQKVGVSGTFNASSLLGLQAGDAADRTAKATEDTAKNTKRLVQKAQAGGLTFG